MRVALDATPLTLSSGGLARYACELSRALAENFPEDEFLLASDQPFAMPADAPANLRPCGGPRNALERRWWSWGLAQELRRSRIDVFHGTNFETPCLPLYPSVLTLHDVSPWMNAGWRAASERVRRRAPPLIRLGLAGLIIVPSEAVRRQAISMFAIHPNRITTVPYAASPRFQPAPPSRRGCYFLAVGAAEPRKNIAMLIEAWRVVRARFSIDLVIAGRPLAGLRAEPGLEVLGEVSDEALAALYSGALAFLYPSLYEGFGLPVLEAMQCGAAVIASRDPAITEVVAGAAVQVDAQDVRGWREALEAAAQQPEWVAGLRARSLERARDFSWDRTARRTRAAYEEALARR